MRRFRNLRGRRRPNRLHEKKYRGFDFDRIYAEYVNTMFTVDVYTYGEDEGFDYDDMRFWDLSSNAEREVKKDIEKFIKLAGEDTIENYVDMYSQGQYRRGEDKLGANFYLTRNGHGAGFFDDKDIYSKKLDKIADRFGEMYPEIGDDNEIEVN